jgi:hypothetical protein
MGELTETIEGTGELELWDRPEKRISVGYHFEITTRVIERPGFPFHEWKPVGAVSEKCVRFQASRSQRKRLTDCLLQTAKS